jgi:putative glutamine amidotransferase
VRRPLVVVPARLAAQTSALRYAAVVNARALVTMVHAAGAEPLSSLPWPDGPTLGAADIESRLGFADAVLLPGGGDLDPTSYGEPVSSEHVYDVDALQDTVDLAIARWAIESTRPLLAVCRGLHVVNVALGGTLEQHMSAPHREVVHREVRHHVTSDGDGWPPGVGVSSSFPVSCYHHQRIARLATGLQVLARAGDDTIEAVSMPSRKSWFLGVQWHPEDTPADATQAQLVTAFVDAAR